MKICSVEGCERKHVALGLCFTHWRRQRRGREVGGPILDSKDRICSVEGCERKHSSLGFCKLHYRRMKQGMPLDYLPHLALLCTQEGCTRNRQSELYCNVHRLRERLGIDMDQPIQERTRGPVNGLCTFDDCIGAHVAKGFCSKHYRKFKGGLLTNQLGVV